MVCRKERTLSDFWWREQGFMRGAEKARAQDLKEHIENDQSISVPVQLTQSSGKVIMNVMLVHVSVQYLVVLVP